MKKKPILQRIVSLFLLVSFSFTNNCTAQKPKDRKPSDKVNIIDSTPVGSNEGFDLKYKFDSDPITAKEANNYIDTYLNNPDDIDPLQNTDVSGTVLSTIKTFTFSKAQMEDLLTPNTSGEIPDKIVLMFGIEVPAQGGKKWHVVSFGMYENNPMDYKKIYDGALNNNPINISPITQRPGTNLAQGIF